MHRTNLDRRDPTPPADPTDRARFAAAVVAGLSATPKTLPCQYFYDAAGAALFEAITGLPEYYLTRTEIALLTRHADEVAARIGQGAVIVEYGAGSMRKTPLLLSRLARPRAYVPIDVSEAMLAAAAEALGRQFPTVRVVPVLADFGEALVLPATVPIGPVTGFFPGSTIGNLTPAEAHAFLRRAQATLGAGAWLLVGVDLKKPLAQLLPAYDDAAGVTAAFNRNLLVRANRELGTDFDLDGFAHAARWNEDHGRIEMHLVARTAHRVRLDRHRFDFAAGESIHTENSHKFTVAEFKLLARSAGWTSDAVWTDADALFSLHLFRADG